MNQNATRNSDGFKIELGVFTTFCVVYSAQSGFSSVKSATFSPLQDPVRFTSSAVKSSKPAFLLLSSISLEHLLLNQFPMLYEGTHELQPLSLSYVKTAVINTSFPDTLPFEGTIVRKDGKKFQDGECFLFCFSEITLFFCVPSCGILFSDLEAA